MAELMTLEEVASFLRVGKRTMHRLLKDGRIPGTKVGRQWRFDKALIDEWLHRNSASVSVNILVIDDDELTRALFRETLEELGHRVVTARNGTEGLDLVKRREFSLVFLDLKMPGMDGAEVFQEIRTAKPNLPVTIVTGYPDSNMMARALAQGPFGVMRKPFDDADIRIAVNSFLHTSETRRRRAPAI